MSEHAPAYGIPPHSKSCARPETPEQLHRANKYAAELVDLTELVGWFLGVGQYSYVIERMMAQRSWGVVRRRTMEVVGEFPSWLTALRNAREHADARE